MSSTDHETLDRIHRLLASAMEARLEYVKEEPLTAAEITAYAKFLKDNGVAIDLTAAPSNTPGKAMVDIPFPQIENQTERVN